MQMLRLLQVSNTAQVHSTAAAGQGLTGHISSAVAQRITGTELALKHTLPFFR